ncbi:MAG TPA: penicillin-binding protein, partial [Caldithrix sp.]|nr:penicillin-binding protein [Caldithrix sp.]
QQLAKNLYLSTEKSFLRKIKEYFIAKRLEKELSKYRIFHLYLNVIEFGRGVFGVEAASRFYFGKSVGNLTLEEMVRLTAIIPRPLITNPKGNSRWLKWKCKWILRKLALYNYIDQAACDAALLSFE